METTIYRTIVIVTSPAWDIDSCYYEEDREVFDGLFTSKKEAIRQAQKKSSKYCKVWARVIKLTIGECGVTKREKVYNLYRKENTKWDR